jgi:hypothetical protein
MYRHQPKQKKNDTVIDELNTLVTKHPAIDFW